MRWLPLLLVLATAPPAPGEVGAKAMFKDPSLDVIHFSPHAGGETPVGEGRPAEPTKVKARKRTPAALAASQIVPSGSSEDLTPAGGRVRSIGIRFWVQRVDDRGNVLEETAVGHIFRSAERIQLVVESNTEGYLAVVQQGSDGRAGLLFPSHESQIGTDRIPAHVKVILPGTGHSFTFDQQAGTERLLIVLVCDRQELAALPLRREMTLADLTAVRQLAVRELGAKNLFIETFADPKDDPATYAVNRAGSAIVQEVALVHEEWQP
jgi:hypothetical protein